MLATSYGQTIGSSWHVGLRGGGESGDDVLDGGGAVEPGDGDVAEGAAPVPDAVVRGLLDVPPELEARAAESGGASDGGVTSVAVTESGGGAVVVTADRDGRAAAFDVDRCAR